MGKQTQIMIMKTNALNKPKIIKAVIFDLDGTLLYTLEDIYLSVNYALAFFNEPTRSLDEIKHFTGNGVKVLIDKSVQIGSKNRDAIEEKYRKRYEETALDHIKKYEGIEELLKELKKLKIKTAIETNKFQSAVDEIYEKYFSGLIDIPLGEKPPLRRKPYPDMSMKVLELLNLTRDEVVYVGDSETDLETANNANLYCLSCTWGFRTREELLNAGAYHLIDKPSEIIDFIKEINKEN